LSREKWNDHEKRCHGKFVRNHDGNSDDEVEVVRVGGGELEE
jgi:hypothetical protein